MEENKLNQLLIERAKDLEAELISIRRHLHQHPELSFQEFETANYVEEQLNKHGIPNKRIGETGVVATITGEKEGSNFTIGLRADIDALPIQEETGLPFSSENEGVMHACGHDGHTTILLGTARLLFENRKHFSGTVVCIFQPGEEADGAARELIRLGVLENPKIDAMLALHLWPYLPLGIVGVKRGSMTASCDDFTIEVIGKSGHSARPHEGIDAISVSMHIMQAIQHFVTKTNNPLNPVVVHIGKIEGGSAGNIIADRVKLEGTTRALSMENRKKLAKGIEQLVHQVASTYKAKANLNYRWGHAPVMNNDEITDLIKEAVQNEWGEEGIAELSEPSLGADDFGDFSQAVPSSYFRLGIKKEGEEAFSLHHPKFDFDEKLLAKGVAIFAVMALKVMREQRI
jgi:amidohydrolase